MQPDLFDSIDDSFVDPSRNEVHEETSSLKIDLSYFLEPPELSQRAILKITPIAPISLSSEQPGTYYQSLHKPTYNMLYGLLENAAGLHLDNKLRTDIIKSLRKRIAGHHRKNERWKDSLWIKQNPGSTASNVGFFSIFQFHIQFQEPHVIPAYLRFTDLWARHVHSNDTMFPNGSRNHDYTMDRIQGLKRSKQLTFSDLQDVQIKEASQLPELEIGNTIHPNAVRSWYPAYYASPTPREYLDINGAYQFPLVSTPKVLLFIKEALQNPQAPLYLGSNDGWVDVKLEDLT